VINIVPPRRLAVRAGFRYFAFAPGFSGARRRSEYLNLSRIGIRERGVVDREQLLTIKESPGVFLVSTALWGARRQKSCSPIPCAFSIPKQWTGYHAPNAVPVDRRIPFSPSPTGLSCFFGQPRLTPGYALKALRAAETAPKYYLAWLVWLAKPITLSPRHPRNEERGTMNGER